MKNFIGLFCAFLLSLGIAQAEGKNVKIKVKQAGMLAEMVKKYPDADVKALTLSGSVNAADIQALARFVGREGSAGRLETLDLSQTGQLKAECGLALRKVVAGATSLKHIVLGDMVFVSGNTFVGLPNLESVDFTGNVGHIDGYVFTDLPRLQRICFHKMVASTGGAQFVKNCPQLTSVVFCGPVIATGYGAPMQCPQLKGYTLKAPVLAGNDEKDFPTVSDETALKRYNWKSAFAFMKSLGRSSASEGNAFMADVSQYVLGCAASLAETIGDKGSQKEFEALKKQCADAMQAAEGTSQPAKEETSKLEILKQAAPYKRTGQTAPAFTYASPNDSLLTRTRNYFNLDQVAGNGDELSRIKNLLYWVHDLVRHDGSSSWPKCKFNCVDLYKVCQAEKRGLNCRFMAIMLCEALLSEGIPARYLTCESKAYDTDQDCHVITIAWSRQLNKWVWVDPTFCAYVTDENGLWLHPGEVRERLRTGQPLVLNEDANWNHENTQTKAEYLENYMAKNLYLLQSNLSSMSEPEGEGTAPKTKYITLVPEGFQYKWGETTTDDAYFWQAPPKELVK